MIDGGGNGEAPEVRGPVNSPGKKAEDPWKDIAKQVADGKLRFEPAAATKAATECVNALAGISRIQEKLNGINPLSPLSQLKSGSALATLFNATRHGLGEVLQTHSTALDEMLNTFKDAGKKYIEVDLDSAHDMDPALKKSMIADLDGIKPKSAADAGKFQTKMPKRGKAPETEYMDVNYEGVPVKSKEPRSASELEEQGIPFGSRDFINGGKKLTEDQIVDSAPGRAELSQFVKPAGLPDTLVNSMGSNQTQVKALELWRLESGPNPENPASQSWRDLYNLGQTAGHAVKPVLDAALAWQSMANELKKTSKTLAEYAVDKSLWEGHGVDGAVKAVENYHTKAKALATQINDMGKTLEYTSEWLANTKVGMPQNPDPPKPVMVTGYTQDPLTGNSSYNVDMAAANQRNLAIHRQNMENNYVQGVQTSSLFVPSMDKLPVTTPKSEQPDGKQDTGADGKGGGTDTTPSGGGTGPIPTGGGTGPMPSGGGTGTIPTAASNYSPVDPSKLAQGVNDRTASQAETPNYTATTPASADPTQSATQTSGVDGLSQAAGLAQQGIGGAQSALQAAAQAAQQAAASGLTAARANAPAFPGGSGASTTGGGGASKIGGGAGLSGSAAAALQKEADAARLFPRANAAGPASPLGRLSGMPGAGVPATGAPGSPGAGAGQGQGQSKESKRPKYLESTKHLEEALGEPPAVGKAVVEK
ncbi:hypothetical protein ACQP2U_36115 [Nocardia sp. CA-084685]|uniref:hypothetical protein n=1 Tax=Nocardia sp. CA-084685 TaxID=3239970 RepID=UPI003D961647